MKKIMLVGGGTVGHIAPLVAIAHELKQQHKQVYIIAVTDKNNQFIDTLINCPDIDSVKQIVAGKLRRYPNRPLYEKLFDITTLLKNLIDIFKTVFGTLQSIKLMAFEKPEVVFIKGGFVSVPVGISSRLFKIPFLTHDSDVIPGLANRIIGRWAQVHTVGMPVSYNGYDKNKTYYVGIPIDPKYKHITKELKSKYRRALGLKDDDRVLVVIGGSQGAKRINSYVISSLNKLLEDKKNYVFHQTGKSSDELSAQVDKRYKRFEFSQDLETYTGAADVIVTRAGSSSIAELSVQGKAIIVIPSPYLAGGHQIANAERLESLNAAVYLSESSIQANPDVFAKTILDLLDEPIKRRQLEDNITKLAVPDSAKQIVKIINDITK